MANGHVKINDIFCNDNGLTRSTRCDPKSTSDTESMEDTEEYRLLMAYAKRRRRPKGGSSPQDKPNLVTGDTDLNNHSPLMLAKTEKEKEKKTKKKRKGWKRHLSIFSCIKPQTEEVLEQSGINEEPLDDHERRAYFKADVREDDELKQLASKLTRIADEIPFLPPDLEPDSPADDVNVERMIGLLLRESGDRLNERELKDSGVGIQLFGNYDFFKLLISTLLMRMGLKSPNPDSPGPKASPKTQIAVMCEITCRLSAVNTLPGNQLLGHGARYLQHNYASWVQQQGGYETAFYSDDEDDIQ
ncbi:uncharacterized protein LOC115028100 [Cottoperca gobio]|uniref:Uncharacterized protein LOC115028100 n=1 Tax=Cottoperca gobio TaxID=56716 RepID=A0A6J2S2C3_COTGO|nr:apoptosis facilitator Bcl-2-like protein 14 [Cottoperca gobio]